jgi:hypothetical protein
MGAEVNGGSLIDESDPREDRGSWDGQGTLGEGSAEWCVEVVSSVDLDHGAWFGAFAGGRASPLDHCVPSAPRRHDTRKTSALRHAVRAPRPPVVIPRPRSLLRLTDQLRRRGRTGVHRAGDLRGGRHQDVDWVEGVKCKQLYVLRDVGLISLFVKGRSENNLDGHTNVPSHRNFICATSLPLAPYIIS